jgi:hypothetical protein
MYLYKKKKYIPFKKQTKRSPKRIYVTNFLVLERRMTIFLNKNVFFFKSESLQENKFSITC